MALSSASRQHRKSMLPTPRLSARISSRRAASGDTSRIAWRVPSPLLPVAVATPQQHNGSTAQARGGVPHPAANSCHLSPPTSTKLTSNTRLQAGSQSRPGTPGLLGRTSCPMSEQSGAASRSLIGIPRPEAKKAGAPHQAASLSVSYAVAPKDEQRLKTQDGRAVFAQHQEPETRNPATTATAASARLQHRTARRPASTAFASGFSRIENTSSGDGAGAGALPSMARKKPSFTVSVSGKENRQPQIRTRVPAPPVTPLGVLALPGVPPPRTTRRTVAVVAQPSCVSFRAGTPCPLVVRKRTLHAPAAGPPRGDSRIRSAAAGAPFGLPAGIKTLMDDIDCFAKEWSEMFDELSAGVDGPEGRPSKLDSFTRMRPILELESTAPSGSAGSVNTLRVSPLVSTDGETIHVDVKLVTLAIRQHRENAMVKIASVDDKSERDLPGVSSTLGPDPPSDRGYRHPQKDLRNASPQLPPQASRYHQPLLEIKQSPIIASGTHLGEMAPVGPSNRTDELAKLPESHPIIFRGTDTTRRNGATYHARIYPPATLSGASSPLSTITSLSSATNPYLSSPWVNLQGREYSPQRIVHGASDAAPMRSSSLRGLRAIFKRTSAGLTSVQRQRVESLKGLIGEPRILSLGSISISNLRDAGVAGGGGSEENTENTGELARKTTVKW